MDNGGSNGRGVFNIEHGPDVAEVMNVHEVHKRSSQALADRNVSLT